MSSPKYVRKSTGQYLSVPGYLWWNGVPFDVIKLIVSWLTDVEITILRCLHRQQVLRGAIYVSILSPKVAHCGHLTLLRWFIDGNYLTRVVSLRDETFNAAVAGGYLHILQYLHSIGWKGNYKCYCCAAEHGQLDVIKWLYSTTGVPPCDDDLMQAARRGQFHILQWAAANTLISREAVVCSSAARGGHLHIVQWFCSRGVQLCDRTMYCATESGNLQLIQWLLEKNKYLAGNACYNAALLDNLDVLKWLHANGCPWGIDVCYVAAVYGHLEVLKWLRANGCPWGRNVCLAACEDDHAETYQWILEQPD